MPAHRESMTLRQILYHFTFIKPELSSNDSYYACRMLLIEFYDKGSTSEYLQFIIDVASEHLELEDWAVLKKFIKPYISKYKALDRRLENVSVNKQLTRPFKR
jgi:hypothetical protein